MSLTRTDFLKRKPNVHNVNIDGFGIILIKPFSGDDIKKFQACEDPSELPVIALILSACNVKGENIFTDEDAQALSEKMEFKHLQVITKEILKISGMINPK